MSASATKLVLTAALAAGSVLAAQAPDVDTIISRSVQANQADFSAAPEFNNKETDKTPKGSKTYQVTMIEGTPYQRLIAVNGKPLPPDQQQREFQKQQQVISQRKAESPEQRRQRIAKWERDRTRDNTMMQQLTKAFTFKIIGEGELRGFKVWRLRATPRPGYQPPNMDSQVLPGMAGQLWIDQKTYQWVKVTAEVIHPVSIEGFLAQVEPGTRFELEKSPVEGGSWQVTHLSVNSRAKVLFLISKSSNQNDTYFDFQPAGMPGQNATASSAR